MVMDTKIEPEVMEGLKSRNFPIEELKKNRGTSNVRPWLTSGTTQAEGRTDKKYTVVSLMPRRSRAFLKNITMAPSLTWGEVVPMH